MKKLFVLIALLALGRMTLAQNSVLLQNPSFEQAAQLGPNICGPYSLEVPGWITTLLSAGGGAGLFQPASTNPCGEISPPPDGITTAYLFHASISQNLGTASTDGVYTMKFFVANRFYWYPAQYSASLTVGSTPLCSTSGYATGDFTQVTLVCPTQRIYGDLTVTLSSNACDHCYGDFQALVDDVSLTFLPVK